MRMLLSRLGVASALLFFAGCGASPTLPVTASQPARGTSIAPGINDPYQDADVKEWEERFEVESREIYRERAKIVALLGLQPGEVIADIGAGTGLFTEPFSRAVGDGGLVYAVDITPEFVTHIAERSKAAGLHNVRTVLCTDDSTELPKSSIDVAFVCDTYHHFEYHARTLWSIRQALRPGGRMFIVDFERIPGKSRPFILEHVRAGKEVFIDELRNAGFSVRERTDEDFLEENYVLECQPRASGSASLD